MKSKFERIEYLNKVISSGDDFIYNGPKYLYKYRPFDEFTFDMLDNSYIYLCPAMELDDETECMTSVDAEDLMELETNNLKRVCVEQIIQMIKPYCTEEVYETVRQHIYETVLRDGTVRRNFLLDVAPEIQEAVPSELAAPLINWLGNIPEKLDDPSIKPQMEALILKGLQGREKVGVCSLSEDNNIDYMWNKYATNRTGYCVEYDVTGYEHSKDLFPVIYEDDRQTNIVLNLVANFIGQLIISFSNNQIKADISQYLRLFLTKYTKWEYQNEWRVLGDARGKPNAPKITRIIVGKYADDENKNRIKEFCLNHLIKYSESE